MMCVYIYIFICGIYIYKYIIKIMITIIINPYGPKHKVLPNHGCVTSEIKEHTLWTDCGRGRRGWGEFLRFQDKVACKQCPTVHNDYSCILRSSTVKPLALDFKRKNHNKKTTYNGMLTGVALRRRRFTQGMQYTGIGLLSFVNRSNNFCKKWHQGIQQKYTCTSVVLTIWIT